MKPLGKVKIEWSSKFAYAIGLLTTDGNLSKDGRHISFTSKDQAMVENFKKCLGLSNTITKKSRAQSKEKKYFHIQFGDILFYRFLLDLGLSPAKSKILKGINVPSEFFFDFLRGHFDGDGSFYSYWDPRWKSSFMFYLVFISASQEHIEWLQTMLKDILNVKGHITHGGKHITYQLKYAKEETRKIVERMYAGRGKVYLLRKRLKILKALSIISKV